MRSQSIALLAAAALLALVASPVLAQSTGGSNGRPGGNGGSNGGGGNAIAAPGPVAGVGLGYLVLVGGYYVVRRWRKQNTGE